MLAEAQALAAALALAPVRAMCPSENDLAQLESLVAHHRAN